MDSRHHAASGLSWAGKAKVSFVTGAAAKTVAPGVNNCTATTTDKKELARIFMVVIFDPNYVGNSQRVNVSPLEHLFNADRLETGD
jgi:hypothetical protein